MSATKNIPDTAQVIVPATCNQCPEGGYELISGARREFLLKQMNEALELYQENGEMGDLLNTLQDLVIKGLSLSDLNSTVVTDGSDTLFIGCREFKDESDETRIEISVIADDKRYGVEVLKGQISPIKTFALVGCPLVGSGEQPGCNPETCPMVQQARAHTSKKD